MPTAIPPRIAPTPSPIEPGSTVTVTTLTSDSDRADRKVDVAAKDDIGLADRDEHHRQEHA